MIDAILFDKDGTLFDFRASWGRWARDFLNGLTDDPIKRAALAEVIGYLPETQNFRPDSVVIAATAEEIAATLLPHLPGYTLKSLRAEIDTAAERVEMVEAVPLLPLFNLLKARGLRLGVATNDSEAPARAHLNDFGVLEVMDFVAGADSGYGGKPHPGMCSAFAARFEIDPARILMVGDSLHDLHAGRAAGMKTMAVLTGIATERDLAPHADALLADIGGLPDWLERPVWLSRG